jgi:DUF4097 and DUF4098 domain-containing protein YvlB
MGGLRVFLPVAGLLLLASCDWEDFVSSERYSEDFHYSYALQAGGRLSVENFNGTIDITGWDQPNVDISGSKYGSTVEARDAIKIEIHADAGSVSIRTIRPSAYHSNLGARYVVRVPRRVELDRITSTNGSIHVSQIDGPVRLKSTNGGIRASSITGSLDGVTSNGSIELDGIKGDCTVKTSNGRVKAEAVRGSVDASTSNGSVDLSVDEMHSNGVRVSTSNGGVTVRLPSRTSARLMARTSNSSVSTDFELQNQGERSKHRLEGTIGTGGPLLDLVTSNGSIHVVRQAGV